MNKQVYVKRLRTDESFRAEELSAALTACSINPNNPDTLRNMQLICRRISRFISGQPEEVAQKEAQTAEQRREYKRTWQRERYQNDAEYRARVLEGMKQSNARKAAAKKALQEATNSSQSMSSQKAMSSLERYRTDLEYRDIVRARSKARYHRLKAEAAASCQLLAATPSASEPVA